MKISHKKFKEIADEEAGKIISSLPDELKAPAMSVIFIVRDRAEPDDDDEDDDSYICNNTSAKEETFDASKLGTSLTEGNGV